MPYISKSLKVFIGIADILVIFMKIKAGISIHCFMFSACVALLLIPICTESMEANYPVIQEHH